MCQVKKDIFDKNKLLAFHNELERIRKDEKMRKEDGTKVKELASMLIKHTGNPVIAQSILGHSDIRVTQRYMHLFATELAQAVEKLVIQK